jgi:pyrroloquinoline quinone biosynthesis protein E
MIEFGPRALPKFFIIELTRRCNNNCLYCYTVWGEPGARYEACHQREMSTKEIKDIVVKLQEETNVKSIGLSGGEPLLREDLPEILSFIRGRGIDTVIITNGTLLIEEKVSATIDRTSLYEMTLLSHRREIHDRLVGRQGAWGETIAGMANVKQADGDFIAVFVATKLNFMDLYKTVELAIALGAKGLMYNRMNLGAHNIYHAGELLPTPAMLRENLDTLEELGNKYRIPIAALVVLEPCIIPWKEYKHIYTGWCPLAGENSYFTIDPAGNIRICNHSPTILGNIMRDRFTDIYYNHPYINSFRNTWPEECKSCDHQLKDVCCGGCKAAAEQCYGTLTKVDPFVVLSKTPTPRASSHN